MQRLPRRTVLVSLIATAALVHQGAAPSRAQSSTPESDGASATPGGGSLLPRDVVLPLDAVQEVVPDLATETATGENTPTRGVPDATRRVTYATEGREQRLVLSVDQHPSAADASAAFQEAAEQSRDIPGVEGEAAPELGEASFIGVITQGDETHVGGGALFGDLIVNATLQGYDGTDENKAAVAELIRRQAAHAEQALRPAASPTPEG